MSEKGVTRLVATDPNCTHLKSLPGKSRPITASRSLLAVAKAVLRKSAVGRMASRIRSMLDWKVFSRLSSIMVRRRLWLRQVRTPGVDL